MEQLIKVIEANSGESLHYEAQQEAKRKQIKLKNVVSGYRFSY